jgi:hypothetical protein
MEITDVTLMQVLLLFLAALIATYIRLKDEPVTPISEVGIVGILEIFLGAIIAGFLGMWMLMSQDLLIDNFTGFAAVTATAYGGLATVRALLNTVKKTQVPPVA